MEILDLINDIPIEDWQEIGWGVYDTCCYLADARLTEHISEVKDFLMGAEEHNLTLIQRTRYYLPMHPEVSHALMNCREGLKIALCAVNADEILFRKEPNFSELLKNIHQILDQVNKNDIHSFVLGEGRDLNIALRVLMGVCIGLLMVAGIQYPPAPMFAYMTT